MHLRFYQFVFFVLLLAGCASYPTQELSDARQALKAAQEANAAQHTPITFNKATKLLNKAEHALTPEDTSYATARTHALAAKTEAIKARELSLLFALAMNELNDQPLTTPLRSKAKKLLQQAKDAARSGDDIKASELVSQARTIIKKNIEKKP